MTETVDHHRESVRTLPLRVEPSRGESLDSWLQAIARRYHVEFGQLTDTLGLDPPPKRMVTWLHPTRNQLHTIAAATSHPSSDIIDMTLLLYGRAISALPDATQQQGCLWVRPNSRFCPKCLRDNGGRWQLTWRLNWHFLCLTHQCLLADRCYRCRGSQRRSAPALRRIPGDGRLCAHRPPRDDAGGCVADLTHADVIAIDADDPLTDAQRTIDALLYAYRTGANAPGFALHDPCLLLADVRHLVRWIADCLPNIYLTRHLHPTTAAGLLAHRTTHDWPNGYDRGVTRVAPAALDVATGTVVALGTLRAPDVTKALKRLNEGIGRRIPDDNSLLARHCTGARIGQGERALH